MAQSRNSQDWVGLSSPSHNRPLVPRVERLARHVRTAAAEVERTVKIPFEDLYRPARQGLGFTLSTDDIARRSAWALVSEWLVAASLQAPCADAGLEATHKWFWSGSNRSLGVVPAVAVQVEFESAVELRALLPYLLDPMAAATRRDVLGAHSTPNQRRARKASGVYYTPGDVAHMMVERVHAASKARDSDLWLDPAHGSGVFLRAILSALRGSPGAAERIYGVDIDPIAAETAAFVLTAEELVHDPSTGAPWEVWHRFRRNLATGDALLIDVATSRGQVDQISEVPTLPVDGHPLGEIRPWRLETVFPETAGHGFARVVANPPYAPLRQTAATDHLPELHRVTGRAAGADISPVFTELCAGLLSEGGSMAVVLPLSVVASTRTPFPQLRDHLTQQPGWLELLSFDRVPDALFGDDIKTRNSIVHLDKGAAKNVTVSPLYRWTSRTRITALRNVPVVSVTGLAGVPEKLPKIGTEWEKELLIVCGARSWHLDKWFSNSRLYPLNQAVREVDEARSSVIALGPTAYNFLSTMRDPFSAVIDGHTSTNPFSVLQMRSEREASAAYALLSSHLAFWLWHVGSDGFHVTSALHRRIPVPWRDELRIARLADLGDRLWKEALQLPVVSSNRGRNTVAYPTWPHSELVQEIDAEVGSFIGMDYGALLAGWHERLIVVDRESERRNLIRRKNL